jgi:hypothetical protein
VVSFIPGERFPRYPLNRRLGGPQSLSGRFGEENNLLPVPGIQAHFLGCPISSVVTIRITLSRLSRYSDQTVVITNLCI